MSTSGVTTFEMNRNEIIRQAALLVNAIGAGQTMGAQMLQDFAIMLNAMMKNLQADPDLHLWTTTEATLFLAVGQVRYGAGTGATDHITQTYYETAITSDEVSGQTVLSLDSTTNINVADHIGIVLDDGTLFWTTVVSKTSTTVTITDALTDQATQVNAVFTYTSRIVRPLRVVDARRYDIDSATDTPLIISSRQKYQSLPMKTEAGTPIEVFYDAQLNIGYFYVWQIPDGTRDLVKFTWHRPIMDFTVSADTPDCPPEWGLTLIYNLAELVMPQYPVSPKNVALITDMAPRLLEKMKGHDRENESWFVQPDLM